MHHKFYTKGEGDEILEETHNMFIENLKTKSLNTQSNS